MDHVDERVKTTRREISQKAALINDGKPPNVRCFSFSNTPEIQIWIPQLDASTTFIPSILVLFSTTPCAYEDGVPLALEVQDFPRKFLDQGLVLEVRKVAPSFLHKNLHLRLSCIAFP